MNILRRISLSRLLLVCALVLAIGVSATALAFALGSGPKPAPKPLAQAVHDALAAPPVQGVSANITLTNHLLEGLNLASGGGEANQLSQSPLISGASGRLWISNGGRMRLELQAEKGDTQIIYDGKTLSAYDASTNTLYRYTPKAHAGGDEAGAPGDGGAGHEEPPSVAQIEERIAKLSGHANVSGATPSDVAGQPAYTVRVSPKEGGSLIGGAELSWDAVNGAPLRFALYSSTSSSPVIELAATEVSFGPVDASVFNFATPPNAKVEEVTLPHGQRAGSATSTTDAGKASAGRADGSGKAGAGKADGAGTTGHDHPNVTTHGHGLTGVTVLESQVKPGEKPLALPSELPKVHIDGTTATELPTALGTLLSFERAGVRYLLVGAVAPEAIEAVARGL